MKLYRLFPHLIQIIHLCITQLSIPLNFFIEINRMQTYKQANL